jgi:hypothetical protein
MELMMLMLMLMLMLEVTMPVTVLLFERRKMFVRIGH